MKFAVALPLLVFIRQLVTALPVSDGAAAEVETRDHETVQARVGKNGGGNADNVSFRFNV